MKHVSKFWQESRMHEWIQNMSNGNDTSKRWKRKQKQLELKWREQSTNVACIRSMEHNNWNEQRKREREHWPSQFNVEALSGMQRTQGLRSTGGRRVVPVGGNGDRCQCPSSPTLITSSHPLHRFFPLLSSALPFLPNSQTGITLPWREKRQLVSCPASEIYLFLFYKMTTCRK